MKKAYIFKGKHTRIWNSRVGSAYWFIYVLAFALILGLLFIIFNQILNVYLYPTTLMITGGNTTDPDKWLGYWGMMPYIIILIIGLFLFFRLTQSSTGEY